MQNVSQFLKSLDQFNQDTIIEQIQSIQTESLTKDDIKHIIESKKIESFKQDELLEYLDANRDKLLARVQFNENDPVRISDDFAPMAGMHGVVRARGEGNTFRVKFDDKELDIPEQHLIRCPAPVEDSKLEETKVLIFSSDGALTETTIQSTEWTEKTLAEDTNLDISAILPTELTEKTLTSLRMIADEQLSESQNKIRDEVMASAANIVEKLEQQYGEYWTDVLFGAATNHALFEDSDEDDEPEKEPKLDDDKEINSNEIFSHVSSMGDKSTITRQGDKFVVFVIDKNGDEIENKTFDDINQADQLVQNFM